MTDVHVWDVDHVVPRVVDPSLTFDPDNVGPAHRECNRAAGARLASSRRRRESGRPAPKLPPVAGTTRAW